MSSNCIVSQVHIPDFDVQGSLESWQKIKLVNLSIRSLRAANPDAYIIFTGHGHRPSEAALSLCDHVYWEDECRPIDRSGYLVGMPAQFFFVSKGIKHAAEKGFDHVLKTRGDCVIGVPNIVDVCRDIMLGEEKRMVITQQTGRSPHEKYSLGDCFIFGETDLMNRTWDMDNPVYSGNGLENTGFNYAKAMGRLDDDWNAVLRDTAAFRDLIKFKFTCLRWNFHGLLERGWDDVVRGILDLSFDFENYHWGKANGWHGWDDDLNMTLNENKGFFSEKEFYEQ